MPEHVAIKQDNRQHYLKAETLRSFKGFAIECPQCRSKLFLFNINRKIEFHSCRNCGGRFSVVHR
jgi:hydrogenase maturation factor HypF (carbamoyltransferase family)